MSEKSDAKQLILLSAVFVLVSVVNSFCYSNRIIMYALISAEVVFLLLLLLQKKFSTYFCFYCGFLSLSLEFSEFVGSDFYGLKTIKIAGVNLGVLLVIPLLASLLLSKKQFEYSSPYLRSFFVMFVFIICIAFFVGLFNYITNDNGVRDLISLKSFIDSAYPFLFVFGCYWCVYLMNGKGLLHRQQLENGLYSIIVAVAITMLLSAALKNYGKYGGIDTLQVSSISMALPCALVVFIYKRIRLWKRALISIAALVILVLSLKYNANGKSVLSIGITIFFILYILFFTRRSWFIAVVILLPFLALLGFLIIHRLVSESFLLKLKFDQAMSTIAFWKPDWLKNMSASPRFRIEEFLTICNEYYFKPYALLFGKGFLGTTRDNLGYYLNAGTTSFSEIELQTHLYFNMHESLNNLFLISGLFGLTFFFWFLLLGIKSSKESPWGVLGVFWFAFFIKYSVTISVFGITCFAIALSSLQKKPTARLVYENSI